ncbi:MAG: hypothetical protein ABIW47_04170 [Ginsengibacter sp.]
MNTEKEKLLYDTYQSFMDKGLGRATPDTLNEIVSKDMMGFAFEKVSPFTNQQFPFKQKNQTTK